MGRKLDGWSRVNLKHDKLLLLTFYSTVQSNFISLKKTVKKLFIKCQAQSYTKIPTQILLTQLKQTSTTIYKFIYKIHKFRYKHALYITYKRYSYRHS